MTIVSGTKGVTSVAGQLSSGGNALSKILSVEFQNKTSNTGNIRIGSASTVAFTAGSERGLSLSPGDTETFNFDRESSTGMGNFDDFWVISSIPSGDELVWNAIVDK